MVHLQMPNLWLSRMFYKVTDALGIIMKAEELIKKVVLASSWSAHGYNHEEAAELIWQCLVQNNKICPDLDAITMVSILRSFQLALKDDLAEIGSHLADDGFDDFCWHVTYLSIALGTRSFLKNVDSSRNMLEEMANEYLFVESFGYVINKVERKALKFSQEALSRICYDPPPPSCSKSFDPKVAGIWSEGYTLTHEHSA